ncbi:DUF456 domain-containing protein [Myxococcota bacterium]|nr:DUF456 domain-containing protein [Myxococcota bacterium]
MASSFLLWILCTALILVGLAGAVLPALPGTAFVLAGIVLGAWIDGFTRVGVGTLAVIATLGVLSSVLDYVAGMLGARRVGASRLALVGAAAGTIVGVFLGFVGVLFMPLVGAAVGEYAARRDERRALEVGAATGLALVAAMLVKIAIAFVMVGIFVVALVF